MTGLILILMLIAASVFGCAVRPTRSESTETNLALIEQRITQRFGQLEAPGAVYVLLEGDQPAIRLALGHADENRTRPIRFEDHFRLASVTKLFVGQVVLQLLDEGRLTLDDPIAQYVDGVPGGERITLRMLGRHTSGLPMAIANPRFQKLIESDPARAWTARQTLDFAFELPPVARPGERFNYSNTNTVLLGMVIEKLTGRSWQEAVQARLLEPLALGHIGFPDCQTGALPQPSPRGYRFGRKDSLIKYGDVWFDATDWNASWTGASGDMYGTLDDLSKFTRATARGELLGPRGREAMFDWYDTKRDGIEAGFHVFRQNGAIGGVGDVPGFSAFAAYLPDRDITVVCLANLTATRTKLTAAAELGELTIQLLARN
jgi:D-alanyl-D-alanine carboxypeptidase